MLAYTEHQHFSKKITRKKPLAPNDKRCTHAHHPIAEPHANAYAHRPYVDTRHEIFKTARHSFSSSTTKKLSPTKETLSPTAQNKILAHHTHIRLRLPVCRSITWHPRAPSNILPYPTPLPRHPTGYLARDLLYGSTLSSKTSLTPTILRTIYIIYV